MLVCIIAVTDGAAVADGAVTGVAVCGTDAATLNMLGAATCGCACCCGGIVFIDVMGCPWAIDATGCPGATDVMGFPRAIDVMGCPGVSDVIGCPGAMCCRGAIGIIG